MKTLQIKKTIFSMMLGLGLMVGTTPVAAEIIFDDFGGTPKTYSFGTAPLSTTPALLVELDLPAGKKVKIERFGYGSVNYFQILSVDVNQSLVGSFYYAASAEAGESWGNVSSDSVGNWGNITSLSTDYFTTEHLRENPTYIPFRFTDTTDGNKQKYGSVKCSTELTGSGNASVLTLKIYSYAYQTDGSEIAMGAGGSTIVKADQAIDFPAIAAQDISGSVALEASASSGLPVAFTVIDGPGNLAGTTLTFSAAGTVAVVAAQAGDGSWNAAAPVTNRVSVYTLTAFSGPAAGGNSLTITYGELGSVTTVLIGGVSAAITEQGAGWVTITMPTVVSEGTKDIVIQTTDNSDITLPGAYTVNPAGMIWNPTFIKGAPHIAGDYHSMALKADGSVAVWGRADYGQLNVPAPNSDFVAVSAGGGYCLALKADGTISGWGRSPDRQTAVPAPNSDFVAISAADIHSLGLKADGSVVGWGTNTLGQLIVPAPNSDFVAIAAGYSGYSLGLKADGRIVAWGRNDYNQTDVPSPNSNFVAMSAGHRHALGLKADGSVVGWGTNTLGQLTMPTPNSNFVAVAAGAGHSLGLKADGSIVAWGDNSDGQLDVPSPNDDFVAVAAGAVHSLGLKADGTILSWGNNRFSQLNVPDSDLDYGLFEYGVTPSYGVYTGGYEVVISGTNLCDGTINDIEWVTICGFTGSVARVSGSTQIVVRAGQGATIGRGDVRVVSTRFGETVKSNAFTYQRAEQAPLIFEPITPQAYRVKNELSTSGGSGTGAVSYRVISGPGTIMDGPKLYVSAGSGTIEIRATKAQDDLFYATSAIATVQAIRGAAILTLSDLTHTYDGTPKHATVTTDPQGMEVEVEFTYDGSATPPTEVGSYIVVATVDIENWIGSTTGTLTIAKAAATVTLDNLAQTYDGTPKRAIAVTAPPALPVDLTYDGSETPPTEVGSYSVVATVDLTNWEGSTTGTLVIAKAPQTINFPALGDQLTTNVVALSATASSGLSVTHFNVMSGPAVIAEHSLSFTGSGTIVVVASQSGNTNWSPAPEVTNTFVVSKADSRVAVWPTASTITYGNVLSTSTLSGGTANTAGTFAFNASATFPHAGTEDQTVTFWPTDSARYHSVSGSISVSVNAKGLTVSNAIVADKTYDGTTDATISDATLIGVIGDDITTLTNASTGVFAQSGVGTNITVSTLMELSGDDVSNYSLTQPTLSATITAKTLTVAADAKDKVYGEADPALTYTVNGLVNDDVETDVLSGALSRASGEAVGTYAITQGTLAANDNYALSYTDANLMISTAALTVAADAKSKTYGEADPALTYTVSGLVNDDVEADVLSGALSRDVGEAVGEYTITQGTLAANDNYALSFTSANLTISKASQTITFSRIRPYHLSDTVELSATASSGLPVAFSVIDGPGVLVSNILSFTDVGGVTVVALQAGNENWHAAVPVTNTVFVYTVTPSQGPMVGGHTVTITGGNFGTVTRLRFNELYVTAIDQVANQIIVTMPKANEVGIYDIIIETSDNGFFRLADAYTVNPTGQIWGEGSILGWEERPGLSVPTYYLGTGSLKGELYACGGLTFGAEFLPQTINRVARYDETAWTPVADLPTAAHNVCAATFRDAWVVMGGGMLDIDLVAGIFTITTYTNVASFDGTTWTEIAGLPEPREAGAAAVWEDHLYYLGGISSDTTNMVVTTRNHANVYQYDGSTWSEGVGLPQPIHSLTAQAYNGKLYAIGGITNEESSADVYVYDGSTWELSVPLPKAMAYASSAVLDGWLYVWAGEDAGTSVYRFDGARWHEETSMPNERFAVAGCAHNGALYAVAGFGPTHPGTSGPTTNVYRSIRCDIPGVEPNVGLYHGGFEVAINGRDLGDGTDITGVTLCGVDVQSIVSQSATQIVVIAASGMPGTGDVQVVSASHGTTTKTDAFTYLALDPPVALAATQIMSDTFYANWTTVSNAASTVIDVSTTSDFTSFVSGYENQNVGDTAGTWITGLEASTWYWYRVRSTTADNIQSLDSNVIAVPTGDEIPWVTVSDMNGSASAGGTQEFALDRIFAGAGLTYTATSDAPAVVTAEIDSTTGILRLTYGVSGTAMITVTATHTVTGYAVSYSFTVTVVDAPDYAVGVLTSSSSETAQIVSITNNTLQTASGVMVIVSNLDDPAYVQNGTSVNGSGDVVIEHPQTLLPGESVQIKVVFTRAYGIQIQQNNPATISAYLVLTPLQAPPPNTATASAVQHIWARADGTVVIAFETVPGTDYMVQYRDSLQDGWKNVYPCIRATGTVTYWTDSGQPTTDPHPAEVASRFYRVLTFPTSN